MTNFQLASSTSHSSSSTPAILDSPAYSPAYHGSEEDDNDELTLPFPTELLRKDFLSSTFDPQEYLSSLKNRHQTLEDLRSDLRQRSQLLHKELLDLVNGEYEAFLTLGSDLRGGEERVESVRVGVLGFQREVEAIRNAVGERATEVRELLREKKDLRKDIMYGRALLEVGERIGELEEVLGIRGRGGADEESDFDDEDAGVGDEGGPDPLVRRVLQHAEQYLAVLRLTDCSGPKHPFLAAQRPRLAELRKTLLLDLSAALRRAKDSGDPKDLLGLTKAFGDLGAENEALRVLKGG